MVVNKYYQNERNKIQMANTQLVHLASKQRMLCEGILKETALLHAAIVQEASIDTLNLQSLSQLKSQWETHHSALQQKDFKLGATRKGNKKVFALLVEIQPAFKSISQSIQKILEDPSVLNHQQQIMPHLFAQGKEYLALMNVMLAEYETEVRNQADTITSASRLEDALDILSLVIGGIVFFVFWNLSRHNSKNTAMRSIQNTLDFTKNRYETLASKVPVTVTLYDTKGQLTEINHKQGKFKDLYPEYREGTEWVSMIHPDEKQEVITAWEQAIQTGTEFLKIYRILLPSDTKYSWIKSRVTPVKNQEGRIQDFIGTLLDISKIKNAQLQAEKREHELNSLIENSSDSILSVDSEGRILQCNSNFRKFFKQLTGNEIRVGELIGQKQLPDGIRERWKEFKVRGLKGEIFETQSTYVNQQQVPHIFEELIHPVYEKDQIVGITIFSKDITERETAVVNLKKYHQGLKFLNELESDTSFSYEDHINKALELVALYLDMPVGFTTRFEGDKHVVAEYVFNKDKKIFMEPGLIAELDNTYSKSIYDTHKPVIVRTLEETLRDYPGVHENYAMGCYFGVPLLVNNELYGTVCFTAQEERKRPFNENELEFVRMLSRWISSKLERKRYEESLVKAKVNAEEAFRAKADFLSNMSHEIRTPLNAMLGTTQLLLHEKPRKDQQENLNLLKFSGENLLSLVNDILDVNKIEAGKIRLEQTDFNLSHLLHNSCKAFEYLAFEKQLKLSMDYDDSISKYFKGDPTRIMQIINNLVSNAMKFTHEGEIKISCKALKQNEEEALMRIAVSDSGIGIAQDKQSMIFNRFTQANSNTSRKYGGTGLGLSIVKSLLELMGSEIQIKSEENKGSVFYFDLLLPKSKNAVYMYSGAKSTPDLSALELHVLLVEDNEANQLIAKKFLEKWGIKVTLAANGLEAVEKVQDKTFDIVLMDLQMPEMDGYEACRVIRSLEDPYFRQLPIIALSASLAQEVQEITREAGMIDYISKPFNPKELNKTIFKHFTLSPRQAKNFQLDTAPVETVVNQEDEKDGPDVNLVEASIHELARGDQAFIKELSFLYKLNIEELLDKFTDAVVEREKDVARSISHKIKPTIEMLHLDEISEITERIKSDLQKRYWKQAREKLKDFKKACQHAIALLDQIHQQN